MLYQDDWVLGPVWCMIPSPFPPNISQGMTLAIAFATLLAATSAFIWRFLLF